MPRKTFASELDPEFVSINDASRLLSLGRTKLHELIAAGELDSVKAGKRRLIRLRSIRDFGREAA